MHEAGGEEEPIEPVNSQESLNLSILSEDGSDTVARKMEARNAIPPLDIELNEAFSHYFTESAGVLKIQDLSGALVQVLNVFVPPHIVEAALLKIAPQLLQEPIGFSQDGQGAFMALPEAGAEIIPVNGSITQESFSGQPATTMAHAALEGLSQQPSDSIEAAHAVQGLTKTEFVSLYHEVCRIMQEEDDAATKPVLTPANTPGQADAPGDHNLDGDHAGGGSMPRSSPSPHTCTQL